MVSPPHPAATLAHLPVMCVAVVQGFFAYRAFLLMKRNWFVLGLIWVSLPGGLVCQLLLMPGVDTGCVSVDRNKGTQSTDSQGKRSCGSYRELSTTLNYHGTHLRSSSADKSLF